MTNTFNGLKGGSFLAQPIIAENFTPQLSGKITTSSASTSFTFSPLTGTGRQTFKLTNKGSKGAYIGWGVSALGTVTATSSLTTGNGAAFCDYIAAGAILTQDFQTTSTGIVDTIAAIQGTDTQDNGSTIIEISLGFGQ